jgi:hypothetical protein
MSGMADALAPVTPPRVYYFGCGRRVGHWWYLPNPAGAQTLWWGSSAAAASAMRTVFPDIDADYAPRTKRFVEGQAKLTHIRGWTVLAWWDNSVDHRPNSNSAIVANRTLDYDQMLSLLAVQFPEVLQRQRKPIELVQMEGE